MKKKIIVVTVLAVAFVLALTLLGCTQNRVYFSMDGTPNHTESVSVLSNGAAYSDSKGGYVLKGEKVQVSVILEEGYRLGTLKVFLNGEECPLVADSQDRYNACYHTEKPFTVEEDVKVTFAGEPKVATSNVIMEVTHFYESDLELLDDVYIEATGVQGVMTLKEFKKRAINGVKATEEFTVFIYTEGYGKVPFHGCYLMGLYEGTEEGNFDFYARQEFVIDNNRYGYKFRTKLVDNVRLILNFLSGGAFEVDMSDIAEDLSFRQIGLQNNGVFEMKVNGESRANNLYYTVPFYVEDFDDNQEVELSLVFNESANGKMDAITGGLEFRISLDDTPVEYTVEGNTITMKLKRPYEYSADPSNGGAMDTQYAYRYYIRTNLLQKLDAVGLTLQGGFEAME